MKVTHNAYDLAVAIRKMEESRLGGLFGFVRRARAYQDDQVWTLLANALLALNAHHDWALANRPDYTYAHKDWLSWCAYSEGRLQLLRNAAKVCDKERAPLVFFGKGYDSARKRKPKPPSFLQVHQLAAWNEGLKAGLEDVRCPWGNEELRRAAAMQKFSIQLASGHESSPAMANTNPQPMVDEARKGMGVVVALSSYLKRVKNSRACDHDPEDIAL